MDPTLPFAAGGQDNRLEDEYVDAFESWERSPDPKTRHTLLTAVDPVINQAVRSYGGGSTGSPMLRSQARQLAIQSFDSYDRQKGSLRTHLMGQLRRLQRTGAKGAQIISVPEQVSLERRHLDETEREMTISAGREPSIQQLADVTGLSMKRIEYIRQAQSPLATGTLTEPGQSSQPPSMIPGAQGNNERVWEDLVYYDLGSMDQVIFDSLMGAHGKPQMSTIAIANKLGVTPSAISQRARRIQDQLDARESIEGA